MKLSESEKTVIEFVSLLSNVSPNVCKEVYLNLMIVLAIMLKNEQKTMELPYIGELKVSYNKTSAKKYEVSDKAVVHLNPAFKAMILDILCKKEIVLKKYLKQEIIKTLGEKLGITEDELKSDQDSQLNLFD